MEEVARYGENVLHLDYKPLQFRQLVYTVREFKPGRFQRIAKWTWTSPLRQDHRYIHRPSHAAPAADNGNFLTYFSSPLIDVELFS